MKKLILDGESSNDLVRVSLEREGSDILLCLDSIPIAALTPSKDHLVICDLLPEEVPLLQQKGFEVRTANLSNEIKVKLFQKREEAK